jgi:type 1 glutamine amidotransferase
LLEQSGRFQVDVSENPAVALADRERVAGYDLFFLDYNGPRWGEPADGVFVDAVRRGAGVVVLHAADNAFPGFTEYEKMVALMWREGTGHGAFHEFEVAVKPGHPITDGLPNFRTWDELYHRLVHMHDTPYEVLATAYSDPATGGTGNDEPMMVITRYGEGRIYHHVLGHVWEGEPQGPTSGTSMVAFQHPLFQRTLLRGAEWAATGVVTL